MPKKIAAYVRVSTKDQNTDSQAMVIQKWADKNGVSNINWFIDKATGNNLDRPEFKRLKTAILNQEFDTVLCYKLDRISRNVKDGINTLTDWLENKVSVIAVTQDLDFSKNSGKLMTNMLFTISEIEMNLQKERQADGIAVAKTKGKYKGRKTGAVTYNHSRIIELSQSGLSYSEISKTLGCSTKTIQRVLKKGS